MSRKRTLVIVVCWLCVWQLVSVLFNNSILLVGPWETCVALVKNMGEAEFWQTVLFSCLRIWLGLILGVLLGIVFSVASFRYRIVEDALKPVMTLVKAIPVASFVVLFLIWWGASYLSAAISMLVVLPHVYVNVLQGLKNTDPKLLEMAKVFRMSAWNQSFYIYRPSVRPFWNSAVTVAVGMAWKSGVAAQIIGLPAHSVGERLYFAKIYLETGDVLAWTAVTIFLSILTEKGMKALSNAFFQWQPACRARRGSTSKMHSSETFSGIKVQNVQKFYNNIEVIQDWSASYESGEIYYFRMPSGAGKTTRLRILAGLEAPQAGSVQLDISSKYVSLKTCGIAMLFQEDRLCEDYSAIKNIELVTSDEKKAREHLARLLPEDAFDRPCSQLSGGMRRRVALVRALACDSQICLLDEPFNALDKENRLLAMQYIKSQSQGKVLFVATHIDADA